LFGVWSGYGPPMDVAEDFEGRASVPTRYAPLPILELPWREYQLFVGTSAVAASFVSAGRRRLRGGDRHGHG
jgi:hypothetical protein